MKTRLLFILLLPLLAATAWGQVPREMEYSLMVLNPSNGHVLTNKNVALQLQLRLGSPKGVVVWTDDYNVKTDNSGLCQLTLSFPDTLNWGRGEYYMALYVDGKEAGAPKLTSVPYALCAASLEDVITRKELVGTWVSSRDSFTFNSDGTGSWSMDEYNDTFHWTLNKAGVLALYNPENGNYMTLTGNHTPVKIGENKIRFYSQTYTKQ